ncbi:hypothetical protein M1523_03575 [Patescibacteria group bacterium]|nr:hypothetical protein [Patescibacteria group bacterium]MCL5092031.1 hypothetical protein [Patescibacteria group bacterium]
MSRGDERVASVSLETTLMSQGVRRFSHEEMIGLASRVRQEIIDRLQHSQSFPTFLRPVPADLSQFEGKQTIALEVGGTKMRAGVVTVDQGKAEPTGEMLEGRLTDQSGQPLTRFADPTDFFDHLFIALPNLAQLIKDDPEAALSIIFSFPGVPTEQPDRLDCRVTGLTKGFVIPGMIGANFVELFNQYLIDKGITDRPRRQTVFNDTPVLISGEANIGLVVGTGYNFAVAVPVGKLRQILGPDFAPEWDDRETMLVNVESGAIDLATRLLDPEYLNGDVRSTSIIAQLDNLLPVEEKGKQMDEKLVSGKYKGLQLQLILSQLSQASLINSRTMPQDAESGWKTELVSSILEGKWNTDWGIDEADRATVIQVCEIIRDQAAQVVASHLAGAVELTDQLRVKAVAEGSMFWKLPGFKDKVEAYLAELGISTVHFAAANDGMSEAGQSKAEFASLKRGGVAGLAYWYR